jgi:hypothetical protein
MNKNKAKKKVKTMLNGHGDVIAFRRTVGAQTLQRDAPNKFVKLHLAGVRLELREVSDRSSKTFCPTEFQKNRINTVRRFSIFFIW